MIKKLELVALLLFLLHTVANAQVNFSFTSNQIDSFTNGFHPVPGEQVEKQNRMVSYIVNNGTTPVRLKWQLVTGITDRPNYWKLRTVIDNYAVYGNFEDVPDNLDNHKIVRTARILPGDSCVIDIAVRVTVYDDSGTGHFYVRIFDDDLTQVDTLFFRLHKEVPAFPPTSIKSVASEQKKITIYPNPAESFIYFPVTGEAKGASILITDISGRTWALNDRYLQDKKIQSLSVRNLAKGVYLLKVMNSEGSLIGTGKFIKQ